MEGVMMRNKEKYAVAVRKSDGDIEIMQDVYKGIIPVEGIYKIPFLRGIFSFVDSLVLGLKTLNYSAEFYTEEPEGSGKEKKESDNKKDGKKEKGAGDGVVMGLVMIVSILLAVALFMVLPYYASLLFGKVITNSHLLALVEGLIRLAVFVIYVKAISGMEDIKRVFMYHGAEHKCINCIESGNELNVDNVRAASKEHRRCGTSFLLYVMAVSILFFALIDTPSRVMRVVLRIVLIPVIAAVAYELIRLAGKSNNPVVRALSTPGLLMQRLTTREPDDKMIEVGIRSVEAVFDWRTYLKENFGTGE